MDRLQQGKKYWIVIPSTRSEDGKDMMRDLSTQGITVTLVTSNSAVKQIQVFELEI